MIGTINLEDMRLFSAVAEAKTFTAAARRLGVPKQTLSRRVARLEQALGAQLMHRTTRRLQLTAVGAAYAERCVEIVRIASEANRAVSDARQTPSGTLRVTADPVFGEAFLTDIVLDYAKTWPEVRVEVVLTRRKVDLIEEGFDIALRVGEVSDPSLSGVRLGPARVRYCASPTYVARRGTPEAVAELAKHDCIGVAAAGEPVGWPFRGRKGITLIPILPRLSLTSFPMAAAAARAGLGIAIFPEFACAKDVRAKRLVTLLDEHRIDVGSVWLVHAARRFLPARTRAFADLTRERFARAPPWVVGESRPKR
jgi:DNA-binding transcriptional LysR family regulator